LEPTEFKRHEENNEVLYMIKKVVIKLFSAMISSLVLLCIGLAIWYFKRESETSLQDVLFWVGAVPIALFSIGQMGNFSGRGNFNIQFSRSVSNQSLNERSLHDLSDMQSTVLSGMNWFMAGLFILLISYFL